MQPRRTRQTATLPHSVPTLRLKQTIR
jgi:hypothetical protein